MTSEMVIDCLVDWDGDVVEIQAWESPRMLVYQGATCNYHDAQSQAGSSQPICGIVALNCARLVFKSQGDGLLKEELLQRMLSSTMINETMNGIIGLGFLKHVNLQDLLEVPIFQESFTAVKARYELDAIEGFLSYWFPDPSNDMRAVVFSNESEVFMCLSIAVAGSHIFSLFDCHMNTNNPRGPSFTVSKHLDQMAIILRQRLQEPPQVTVDVLTNYSTRKRSLCALVLNPIIEGSPSLDAEALMARSASYLQQIQWKSRPVEVSLPLFAITEHLALLHSRAESLKKLNAKGFPAKEASSSKSMCRFPKGPREKGRTADSGEFGWQLALLNHQSASSSGGENDGKHNKISCSTSGHLSLGFRKEDSSVYPIAGSSKSGSHNNEASSANTSIEPNDAWEVELMKQLQDEEEIAATLPRQMPSEYTWLVALQKRLQAEENTQRAGHESSSISPLDLDWQLAVQLQVQVHVQREDDDGIPHITIESERDDIGAVDAEGGPSRSIIRTDRLRVPVQDRREYGDSFAPLTFSSPPLQFQCSICSDLQPQTENMGPPECGHAFCKECLTHFARSRIEDGRYPIFCPECLAERSRASKLQIDSSILLKLNLTPDELRRLGELELVSHSTPLECPRCKETIHVDRQEYAEQSIIVCPLPRCAHKWCKNCLRTVASSEERHRCKNGNIDRLMKRKGWKYCPGCRTPVQKESGCNHMTCGAPGCNVHFCYRCGVLMIDTTNGGDVGTAVTDHYTQCRLFEKRLRCSIQ